MYQELKQKGVTLIQLWAEFQEDYPNGYGLSQFCEIYKQWLNRIDISMRQEHRPGEKAFSDFAGKTLGVIDPATGNERQAHLFVCTLGATNYTFAKLFWSEDSESWCTGHVGAFNLFQGCPRILVPDNPRPVVTKACPYEPDINPSFAQMAAHYGVAVIPARVRKPKDKAKVEAGVCLATRWILAVLRKRKFFTLTEANEAVAELLVQLNNRPFKKLPGSRRSQFEEIDRPALRPLPEIPYEYAHVAYAPVYTNYHVDYDGHLYSVPHKHRGERVEVRATVSTIEIYLKGKRIASHARSPLKGKATTLKEHQPKAHQHYGDWSVERLLETAQKSGSSTAQLVELIMQKHAVVEQGYKICLGILRFRKTAGDERLEAACRRALHFNALSFKSVKSILDTGLDRRPLPEKPRHLVLAHSNIRGAAAFAATTNNKENPDANPSDHRQHESTEAVGHGESPGSTIADVGRTGTEL
jgi:transposase